jgi:hypothetical protein
MGASIVTVLESTSIGEKDCCASAPAVSARGGPWYLFCAREPFRADSADKRGLHEHAFGPRPRTSAMPRRGSGAVSLAPCRPAWLRAASSDLPMLQLDSVGGRSMQSPAHEDGWQGHRGRDIRGQTARGDPFAELTGHLDGSDGQARAGDRRGLRCRRPAFISTGP